MTKSYVIMDVRMMPAGPVRDKAQGAAHVSRGTMATCGCATKERSGELRSACAVQKPGPP